MRQHLFWRVLAFTLWTITSLIIKYCSCVRAMQCVFAEKRRNKWQNTAKAQPRAASRTRKLYAAGVRQKREKGATSQKGIARLLVQPKLAVLFKEIQKFTWFENVPFADAPLSHQHPAPVEMHLKTCTPKFCVKKFKPLLCACLLHVSFNRWRCVRFVFFACMRSVAFSQMSVHALIRETCVSIVMYYVPTT